LHKEGVFLLLASNEQNGKNRRTMRLRWTGQSRAAFRKAVFDR